MELVYSTNPAYIDDADLVVIPGSKNTVKDLLWLREHGLDANIKLAYAKGIQIIGMCGGYQMLGKKIFDPYEIESRHKTVDGLGLLDIETTFGKEKITCQVEAELIDSSWLTHRGNNCVSFDSELLRGYEIHMGESKGATGVFRLKGFPPTLNARRSIPEVF